MQHRSRAPMPLPPRLLTPRPRAARPTGEKYAFVTLPYAEFVEGTINEDNIGFGALCPLPAAGLPADALVHGLVIFSKRSAAISAWLTGIDLVFVKASLETREVSSRSRSTHSAHSAVTRAPARPRRSRPRPSPQAVTRRPPPPSGSRTLPPAARRAACGSGPLAVARAGEGGREGGRGPWRRRGAGPPRLAALRPGLRHPHALLLGAVRLFGPAGTCWRG